MATGPCARRVVTATILAPDGKRYAGSNYCETPQSVCPRGNMPTGVGYHLCRSVCHQAGHAEVVAIMEARHRGADVRGGTCYIEGHEYACDNCLAELRGIGVTHVVFAAPPQAFGHSGMDSTLDFTDIKFFK